MSTTSASIARASLVISSKTDYDPYLYGEMHPGHDGSTTSEGGGNHKGVEMVTMAALPAPIVEPEPPTPTPPIRQQSSSSVTDPDSITIDAEIILADSDAPIPDDEPPKREKWVVFHRFIFVPFFLMSLLVSSRYQLGWAFGGEFVSGQMGWFLMSKYFFSR
jgi:hypothetical protein